MKERISLTYKIKEVVKKDLDTVKMLDFYFGNTLGIFNDKDIEELLEKGLK